MARIIDFADGAQSETTPTIGNIKASGLIEYPDDATYEATEQGAPTEGNVYFNTTDKTIRYYNGTSWQEVVDENTVQALENKSIDADNNMITNIDNNEIKPLAGIDVTKLHDGSVDNTEFGHLDGVTSGIQGQIDGKQDLSEKGAINGYAPLDANQKVPLANIYTENLDNIDEHPNFASFPVTGVVDRLYVAADTGAIYRWSGSIYVEVGSTVSEISDLTDVDMTGVQDGQVPVWNQANSQFEPGTVQNVIQENIALIGKGKATWTQSGGIVNRITKQTQTDTNDYAMSTGLETGYTFTGTVTGALDKISAKFVDRGLENKDGSITARVYATAGGVPTGAALATSSPLTTSTYGTNVIYTHDFLFAGAINITGGVEYFVSFESTDTGTTYTRHVGTDDVDSANYVENGAPPPDWNLAVVQETIFHRINVDETVNSLLTLDSDTYISVPPLPHDYHTIVAGGFPIPDGHCAYITINRGQTGTTNVGVVIDDITNVTPDNDIIILARNIGEECYFGIHDPQRLNDGDTVDVQKGGGFSSVFEQNTIETKLLSSPVTSDITINDLTFSDLTIGKWYEVSGQFYLAIDSGATDTGVVVNAIHDGSVIDATAAIILETVDASQDTFVIATSFKFQATSTSLTFVPASATANSFVSGNGTRTQTYIQLETRNDLDTNVVSNNDLTQQTVKVVARSAGGVNFSSGSTGDMVYETEDLDTHSSYDNSTGIFTAPNDGVYIIDAKASLSSLTVGTGVIEVLITDTANNVLSRQRHDINDTTMVADTNFTKQMLTGEQLKVRLVHSNGAGRATTASISGYHTLSIVSLPDFTTYGVVNPNADYLETEIVSETITTAADTEIDVIGGQITIPAGTWKIGYNLDVRIQNNSGVLNTVVGRVNITDNSNVYQVKTASYFGGVIPANTDINSSASKQTRIVLNAETTFKLRLNCSDASASGQAVVNGPNITGLMTGVDSAGVLWAERVS